MTSMLGGKVDSVKLATNASIIIALLFSLYQGSAFIATQRQDVDNLQTDIGRIRTHIEKVDDQIRELENNTIVFEQNARSVDRIDELLKDLERTVIKMEAKDGGK